MVTKIKTTQAQKKTGRNTRSSNRILKEDEEDTSKNSSSGSKRRIDQRSPQQEQNQPVKQGNIKSFFSTADNGKKLEKVEEPQVEVSDDSKGHNLDIETQGQDDRDTESENREVEEEQMKEHNPP